MKNLINLKGIALLTLVCAGAISCYAAGKTTKASNKKAYVINTFKENPYLAEIWWGNDYDAAAATKFLNKRYNDNGETAQVAVQGEGGACSSWHKDNFHGRNIDWCMKDFATVIVHMPKNVEKGVKYASVSLVAGNPKFTKDFIHKNKTVPQEFRSWLPATVVDGMNECGVAINHNIVPYEGKKYEKNGDLASVMVCRYVLDNCATAKEAVEALSNKKVTQAVVKLANDYSHFMISDPNSSYVVEWIDGEFVATEFKADGNGNFISANGEPAIMTNYFVGMAEKYGLDTRAFYLNHPNAAGVERTKLIASQLPKAKTLEDHLTICKTVWYRQFCQGKTYWYTENAGNYGYDEQKGKAYWWYPTKENMHWMDNDNIIEAARAMLASPEMQGYYKDFNTNWSKPDPKNNYWYTQHSVVYDLKDLKAYVIMQEGMYSDKVITLNIK